MLLIFVCVLNLLLAFFLQRNLKKTLHLQEILNNISFPIITFDKQRNQSFFNLDFSILFDKDPRNFDEFIDLLKQDPTTQMDIDAVFQKVVEQQKASSLELPLKGEEFFWVKLIITPLADEGVLCAIKRILVEGNNIGESHQENFLNLINYSPVAYFQLDQEKNFVFVNYTLAHWLGSTPYEIIGKNLSIWAEDFSENENFIKDFRKSNGNTIPLRVQNFVSFNKNIHNYVAWIDDEEKRNLSNNLEVSKAYFEIIFEDAPFGIVLIDSNFRILGLNRTFLGMIAENSNHNQQNFIPYIHQDFQDKLRKKINEMEGYNLNSELVEVILTGKGNISCNLSIFKFPPISGKKQWLVYIQDTSKEKKLLNQVLQLQKLQTVGKFVGGISHDFNNILTAIIGFCDMLLLRFSTIDPYYNDIMQIKLNANRAVNLVRQILNFLRQNKRKTVGIEINDLLNDVTVLLQRLLPPNIKIIVDFARDLPLAKIEENQLEQIFLNLCLNARDSMTKGGELKIKSELFRNYLSKIIFLGQVMEKGDFISLEIKDNGSGIEQRDLAKIFDPFFSTKSSNNENTGLGLSTVRSIINDIGGFISVISVRDKGTTFKVFLPITSEKKEVVPEEIENTSDLLGKEKILLVEDDDAIRILISRSLSEKGYNVIECEDPDQALDLIKENDFDLVITDFLLPTMEGTELINKIRELNNSLKFIIISGFNHEIESKIEEIKDVLFLAKPFSIKELAQKVRSIIQAESLGEK